MLKQLFILFLFIVSSTQAEDIQDSDVLDICECPKLNSFSKDILDILTKSSSDDQEALAKIDQLQLMYEIQRNSYGQFQCEIQHNSYKDDNYDQIGLLKSQRVNYTIIHKGIELKNFYPNLFHLVDGNNRVLILRGNLNGTPTYFRIHIRHDGKSYISHLPIEFTEEQKAKYEAKTDLVESKDPTAKDMAMAKDLKDKEVKGFKTKVVDKESGQEVIAFTQEGEDVSTQVTSQSKKDASLKTKVSAGTKVVNSETDPKIGGNLSLEAGTDNTKVGVSGEFSPGKEEPDLQATAKTKQGVVEAQVVVKQDSKKQVTSIPEIKIGDEKLFMKVTSTLKEDNPEIHNASIGTKGEKSSLDVNSQVKDGEIGESSIQVTQKIKETNITAKQTYDNNTQGANTSIGQKTGNFTTVITFATQNPEESLKVEAGHKVTDQAKVQASYSIKNENSDIAIGTQLASSDKEKPATIELNAKVSVTEETGVSKVVPQIKLGKTLTSDKAHVASVEASPSFNQSEFSGVTMRTEYSISPKTSPVTLGLYMEGRYEQRLEQNFSGNVGLRASVDLGRNGNTEILKVHELKEQKIETRGERNTLMAYYWTTRYICDKKRKKLRVELPKKEKRFLFWKRETDLKHLYQISLPLDEAPEQTLYEPKNLRPDTFCKFD